MSKRMNWDQVKLSSKRKLSTKDEAEYRDGDAAARFLNRVEAQKSQIMPKGMATQPGKRTK